MCRLFGVRADRPVGVEAALVSAPHALVRQSCGDLRGECHEDGWGVGYYAGGRPVRVRSVKSARRDPLYAETAKAVVSPTVIGHVRQASVGGASERNTHPFAHGRWLFAHNGTLEGFGADPEPLRRLIPEPLRRQIEGETDSEHAFCYLLGRLEREPGTPDAAAVERALAESVRELHRLYPGTDAEPTRLNFVLTDGEVLGATRWGHTLHSLEQRGPGLFTAPGEAAAVHAVAVASEPITLDGWQPVPDRSVVLVRPDLSWTTTRL